MAGDSDTGLSGLFPRLFHIWSDCLTDCCAVRTNPSNGLNLAIPSLSTIVAVELLRGFLFVGALLPILATLKVSNERASFPWLHSSS